MTRNLQQKRRVSRTTLWLLGGCSIVIVLLGLLAVKLLLFPTISNGGIAVYGDFQLYAYPRIVEVFANCMDGRTPELYLQLPDGSRYRIDELPEEWAAELCKTDWVGGPRSGSVRRHENVTTYTGNRSTFKYQNGKLATTLINYETDVLVGPSRDGPFGALPMDVDEMLQVFGEPARWSRPVKYQGL